MQTTQSTTPALITNPETRNLAGIKSHTKLYDMIKKGEFPAPIKLGARTARWSRTAVEAWIQKKIDDQGAA